VPTNYSQNNNSQGIHAGKKGKIYLRLSDDREEESLETREKEMRLWAANQGIIVPPGAEGIIIENDWTGERKDGRLRPASAFKRKRVKLPNGRVELRTIRPGFRDLLDQITFGTIQVAIVEHLDRILRQPRDGEDLLDAVEISGASVIALGGGIKLTNGGDTDEQFMARTMVNVAFKSSQDTARRVSDARYRLAGTSFQGGPKRYGFRPDPDSVKYSRRLLIVEEEAEVIRKAVADLLDKGVGLHAIAVELNDAGVRSASGPEWTTTSLRHVLTKPANAGLARKGGELVDAPWDPIIDRPRWEQLCEFLADPERRSNHSGPEPKWLVTNFATCGVCGAPLTVNRRRRKTADGSISEVRFYTGGNNKTGPKCCHVQRKAGDPDVLTGDSVIGVEDTIARLVVARLSEPDARHLLKPPPRQGVDVKKLEAERKKLTAKRRQQAELHADDLITTDEFRAGSKHIRKQLDAIDEQLASSPNTSDPLADFRDKPADVTWLGLTTARRRIVVKALFESIVILPVGKSSPRRFDPNSIAVTWRKGCAPAKPVSIPGTLTVIGEQRAK
jgi:DNA invertase Pin-like site-specific DNA recombinase